VELVLEQADLVVPMELLMVVNQALVDLMVAVVVDNQWIQRM